MKKRRPAVIVSPNELNNQLRTVLIAPVTSSIRSWPFRVPVSIKGKDGQICIDQVRVIDKSRVVGTAGLLDKETASLLLKKLAELFAP